MQVQASLPRAMSPEEFKEGVSPINTRIAAVSLRHDSRNDREQAMKRRRRSVRKRNRQRLATRGRCIVTATAFCHQVATSLSDESRSFDTFFGGDTESGDRYREVVQRDQGIWIYSTRQRRQRCIRAHLIERAGLSSLNEGAKVSYEEMENRGKSSAENLRVG